MEGVCFRFCNKGSFFKIWSHRSLLARWRHKWILRIDCGGSKTSTCIVVSMSRRFSRRDWTRASCIFIWGYIFDEPCCAVVQHQPVVILQMNAHAAPVQPRRPDHGCERNIRIIGHSTHSWHVQLWQKQGLDRIPRLQHCSHMDMFY